MMNTYENVWLALEDDLGSVQRSDSRLGHGPSESARHQRAEDTLQRDRATARTHHHVTIDTVHIYMVHIHQL